MKKWGCLLCLIVYGCLPEGDENLFLPLNDLPAPLEKYMEGKKIYFGSLHGHTFYSDGTQSPLGVLQWAKDTVHFDFYAITDHGEQLTEAEWNDLKRKTDSLTINGKFVALRGFEWSSNVYGHCCVFNTELYTGANSIPEFSGLIQWLTEHNAMAQFAHPGRGGNVFDSLAFIPAAGKIFFAIETANRNYFNSHHYYLPFYPMALRQGWHVGPSANQDNHSSVIYPQRTALIADDLSPEGIKEAMIKRRMYATDDPNVLILFKHGKTWMGDSVSWQGKTTFLVIIKDDEPIRQVQLINATEEIICEYIPARPINQLCWYPSTTITGRQCIFVKVYSVNLKDGNEPIQVAVTAPIWFLP